jgi:iron(III) transport system substrate-binding protein
MWGAAICYNLVELQKQGLPRIESWKDLLRPEFKGKIVMPNPNSSGTGFLDVTAWLQMFGEKGGWDYMDKLHENVAVYTHSGSKPCVMAGNGEFPVGIAFEYRANTIRAKGARLTSLPAKRGWVGILSRSPSSGHRNSTLPKSCDWASSRDANERMPKLCRGGLARMPPFEGAGRLRAAPGQKRFRKNWQRARCGAG